MTQKHNFLLTVEMMYQTESNEKTKFKDAIENLGVMRLQFWALEL